MDISNLDVIAASNQGAEMDLMHPDPAQDVIVGKITVLGFDSPEVIAAGRDASKALMSKGGKDLEGALDSRRLAMAKAAVVSVSGIEVGEREIRTKDDMTWLLDNHPGFEWIADQIIQFGGERGHFFPQPQTS